jgi:hypothetical protein
MPTAANPQSQNAPWGPPSNNPAWSGPPFWHPWGIGRPIAIAALVFLVAAGHLGRMLFWPIGLAALVFMVASGRLGCGRRRWNQANWNQGNWGQQAQTPDNQNQGGTMWQSCMPPWARWGWGGGNQTQHPNQAPSPSGNHAFDEYRAETLRRLEDEQKDFSSFLERLRFAKDKAEFDQFMAERRQNGRPPVVPEAPAQS